VFLQDNVLGKLNLLQGQALERVRRHCDNVMLSSGRMRGDEMEKMVYRQMRQSIYTDSPLLWAHVRLRTEALWHVNKMRNRKDDAC
jgi:hypothetical protein